MRQETRMRVFDVVADRGGRVVSTVLVTTTPEDDWLLERALGGSRLAAFEGYHGPCSLVERLEVKPDGSDKRWRVPE
jgi:hypothetical protein